MRRGCQLYDRVCAPGKNGRVGVQPLTTRSTLLELIDREIRAVRDGHCGTIWLKLNSLVDCKLIDKLYEASTRAFR